jgi:hypothetical protein
MDRVEIYSKLERAPIGTGSGRGVGSGVVGGVAARSFTPPGAVLSFPSAGVSRYKEAQALEQLSRTPADREKNAANIKAVTAELSNKQFVSGFGSIAGEEFFSYLNISDSLHRTGGPDWEKWDRDIKTKIVKLQNEDGTWAGQHCITGRVAVTSAAILTLLADREPVVLPTSEKEN